MPSRRQTLAFGAGLLACASLGGCVVMRCSHKPGASSVIRMRLSACLPAKRISSYAIPAITGRRTMRLTISQYQTGRPSSA